MTTAFSLYYVQFLLTHFQNILKMFYSLLFVLLQDIVHSLEIHCEIHKFKKIKKRFYSLTGAL